jgi:DNA-binding MarR family transcriptional regulator
VALTSQGREMVERLQQSKREMLASALAEIPAGEQEPVLRALERMADLVEKLASRCCS